MSDVYEVMSLQIKSHRVVFECFTKQLRFDNKNFFFSVSESKIPKS